VGVDVWLVHGDAPDQHTIENVVWESNGLTHNLNRMAFRCGAYFVVWRPEEIGVELAKDADLFGSPDRKVSSATERHSI